MQKINFTSIVALIWAVITLFFALAAIMSVTAPITLNGTNLENVSLKSSKVSGPIHIDNNWTATKAAGKCTGSGSFADPYIIQDLVINAGGLRDGIYIQESNVYFRIENCTISNAGGVIGAGIRMINVLNSNILNNTIFNSKYNGIYCDECQNSSISHNYIYHNDGTCGIFAMWSNNNSIRENICHNNGNGIKLQNCKNNVVDQNVFYTNDCGLYLIAGQYNLITRNIAFDNTVGFFSYRTDSIGSYHNFSKNIADFNEIGIKLQSGDYTNLIDNTACYNDQHGIYFGCTYGTIIGNNATNNGHHGLWLKSINIIVMRNNFSHNGKNGIFMDNANRNNITENTILHNIDCGFELDECDLNLISYNTVNYNDIGIKLWVCENNIISDNNLIGNNVCIYEEGFCSGNVYENNDCGDVNGPFPFELIIITSIIGGVTIGAATAITVILLKKKKLKSKKEIYPNPNRYFSKYKYN